MIDFLKEWVLNLASLGIFLVLIDILAPSGKSKKSNQHGFRIYFGFSDNTTFFKLDL